MAKWASRGLRGSVLEELINRTNEKYKNDGLCVVQKIPTPITPLEIDNKKRLITKAYFEEKSTVDYIGAVQGIPICFDAKETSHKRFPLQNIHEHQVDFMNAFEKQNGVAFLVVYFSMFDEYYYLPFRILKKYYDDAKSDGRKSIPYDSFQKEYLIYNKDGYMVHYLETINVDLENRSLK